MLVGEAAAAAFAAAIAASCSAAAGDALAPGARTLVLAAGHHTDVSRGDLDYCVTSSINLSPDQATGVCPDNKVMVSMLRGTDSNG